MKNKEIYVASIAAYDKARDMYPGSPSQIQAFMAGVAWNRDNPDNQEIVS